MWIAPGTIMTEDYTSGLNSGEIGKPAEGEVGLRLALRRFPGAETAFTITDVSDDQAKLDFNHPLAGKTPNFSATVRVVRSAGGDQIILPGEP
jgi:FKBP-type peptidyl-prolyl cis-trans isomerase 2